MYPDRGLVELRNPKDLQEPSKDFTFDAIYNERFLAKFNRDRNEKALAMSRDIV